nr:FkbM family methyltransferase [Thioalkalivibrio sp. XN8]
MRATSFLLQRYLLGRPTVIAQARDFDLELRVPTRDAAGAGLYRRGMHAPEVADFLVRRLALEPGDLVFDIGASVGWYTLLLAQIAPRGVEIHAFEPDPWARGLLQENLNRNRAEGVTVVDAAVGHRAGEVVLHRYGGRRRRPLRPGRAQQLPVRMIRLDDYCRGQGLARRRVGCLKIGVQGFEFHALQGARRTLARCRTVLTEYNQAQLDEAGVHPASVLDLMVELGFAPAEIRHGRLKPSDRPAIMADLRPRTLVWTRPAAAVRAAAVDPDALAI